MEEVIIVDADDNALGTMEKLKAHQDGVLHRAFSVLLFNDNDELLIHQRAASKYHSPSLWTNSYCSHPKPGETTEDAAIRRAMEEMGIACSPQFLYKFLYEVAFDNDLIEHELDHVFIGRFNGVPSPNPEEVSDWKYISMEQLLEDVRQQPSAYTHWFKLILQHDEMRAFIEDPEFSPS